MRLISTVGVAIALMASPAFAFTPAEPWPPAEGDGILFVHYGEEHINDADGATILPTVVETAAKYRPKLVTMSADKANDGETDQLELWRDVMTGYDQAGVPYFAAVGNHDRDAPPGALPGVPPPGPLTNYAEVFKDRPYPMGDGAQYEDPMFSPRERPEGDPDGAASHYFVDYGNVRWIFIDNSCWEITACDNFQLPSAQTEAGEGEFDFLTRVAQEGTDAGKVVFVVMHMPTQDPGDQSYRDPIARMHTMGKGTSSDNDTFESIAEQTGVDGVFVGHIKGQFLYQGQGDIPYYIDGGAGGELYTSGPIGTDHGYWHGFRLIRVEGERIVTDTVPIFVKDGITIEGPASVAGGRDVQFEAFGKQPVFNDPAKVEALELRDPDPQSSSSSGLLASGVWTYGRWLVPPGAIFLLLVFSAGPAARRRVRFVALPASLAAVAAVGAAAVAQQSEPTSTPKKNLPTPARIWTSGNPNVLQPVPSADDDPRRDRATQTDSGTFEAICPGRTSVQVTSGWEAQRKKVTAMSAAGKIVRRVKPGRRTRVKLAQPAEVEVRVKRRGRTVRTLADECVARSLKVRWNGRDDTGRARHGRFQVKVAIKSDRKTIKRSRRIRVR